MLVTKIKRIGGTNRFHVYVDEAWAGVFLDEILAKYSFKVGKEMGEAEYKLIKKENDQRVSFDFAVSYLEKYVVTEKGLKDYLKRKGFDDKIIKQTCDKLKEYGMLDDEKFAKNYFESMSFSQGKREIARKLLQKGVAKSIVDELLIDVDENDEIQKAKVIAEKFVKNREKNAKNKQKCLAHLIYKGYDYCVAKKVLDEIFLEQNQEDENGWF